MKIVLLSILLTSCTTVTIDEPTRSFGSQNEDDIIYLKSVEKKAIKSPYRATPIIWENLNDQ